MGGGDRWRWASPVVWVGLWATLLAVALFVRPLLPVDETRYLSVAWEMWRDGRFLVPYLNGEPYSHKPPLLFWLMHLGWAAFGVNDWWPRLIAPTFALAALAMTGVLARRLWPGRRDAAAMAPMIVLGGLFWVLFMTMTMFDAMHAACTLAGLLGIVAAWRRGGRLGFAVFGVAIGVGIVAKGPAIGLHVLPVALLAPLWGPRLADGAGAVAAAPPGGWRRWYLGIAAGLGLGAAVAMLWVVPAAAFGGAEYREAILWGQSAGRMVESFDHDRPWWWFAAILPALVLPWTIWPPLWRAARLRGRLALDDGGVRFCLAWFVPAFVAFSAISGKQPHYLLPELPALALLAAFLLGGRVEAVPARRRDQWLPGGLAILAGAAVVVAAVADAFATLPPAVAIVDAHWGLAAIAAGLVVAWLPVSAPAARIAAVTALSAALACTVHLTLRPYLAVGYDLRPIAERLAALEREGYGLANFGTYHGQYHFLGRLERPMPEVGLVEGDLEAWLAANPKGKIVSYQRSLPPFATPEAVLPYRSQSAVIWDSDTVREHPTAPDRIDYGD